MRKQIYTLTLIIAAITITAVVALLPTTAFGNSGTEVTFANDSGGRYFVYVLKMSTDYQLECNMARNERDLYSGSEFTDYVQDGQHALYVFVTPEKDLEAADKGRLAPCSVRYYSHKVVIQGGYHDDGEVQLYKR